MKRRTFSTLIAAAATALSFMSPTVHGADRAALRVVTHESFDLPKELLAGFERDAGVKLVLIKAGDAGEMLNKLVLTRARPIADVVYGLDNASIAKAAQADVIEPYDGPAARADAVATLGYGAVPIDYGFVTLNIDLAWFEKHQLAVPTRLQDLTQPAYRKLLVVQHPATSSPGFAFLAATIAGLGETAAFDWWKAMRANGVKVARGWSEAYYTDFTRNGGSRPIVVSYASSPAAELFFSKTRLTAPPTRSLALPGGVFRQIEVAALVKGGGQREAAGRFIEFLRSAPVQEALQTTMWMLPADPKTRRAEVLAQHAPDPGRQDNPEPAELASRGSEWIRQWTRVVLK